MSNPWGRKNPLMSMWRSAANKAVASARGQAANAAKKQVAATQAEATRQIIEILAGKPKQPSGSKRRR